MSAQLANPRHLLSVSDHHRLHLRPKAGENIQPLLVDSVSMDWTGLFSY